MLSEEDQRLFHAARRAQVNRNTAIYTFEHRNENAGELLRGALVRVLLELPSSHNEDYALARITGTVEGAPYSGFSTNSTQQSTTYVVLSLPARLAELNGDQFQLNSISNSAMSETEFTRWLRMTREDGERPPTVAEWEAVAARVQPLDAARRSAQSSRVPRNGTGLNNGNRPGSVASLSTPTPAAAATAYGGMGGGAGNAAARSFPPNTNGSTSSLPIVGQVGSAVTVAAMYGGDPGRSHSNPALYHSGPVMQNNYAGGEHLNDGQGTDGRSTSMGTAAFAQQQQQQRQLARHGTTLGYGGLHGAPGNGVAPAAEHAAADGVALQSATPAMVTEETEADRRLRQEVMNHLQTSCTLFPRDSSMYKLSQLRTVERDMIEFLEHVRDEIASKQDNCVVCLDHLPTVIMLPCKHKVLCRLCASTQANCPMCRMPIKEMFEPQEI